MVITPGSLPGRGRKDRPEAGNGLVQVRQARVVADVDAGVPAGQTHQERRPAAAAGRRPRADLGVGTVCGRGLGVVGVTAFAHSATKTVLRAACTASSAPSAITGTALA